jgi:hypothetical protein
MGQICPAFLNTQKVISNNKPEVINIKNLYSEILPHQVRSDTTDASVAPKPNVINKIGIVQHSKVVVDVKKVSHVNDASLCSCLIIDPLMV